MEKLHNLKPDLLERLREAKVSFKLIDEIFTERIKYNAVKYETYHIFKSHAYQMNTINNVPSSVTVIPNFIPEILKGIFNIEDDEIEGDQSSHDNEPDSTKKKTEMRQSRKVELHTNLTETPVKKQKSKTKLGMTDNLNDNNIFTHSDDEMISEIDHMHNTVPREKKKVVPFI